MSKTNSQTNSKNDYVNYSKQQILEWSTQEVKTLHQYYNQFLKKISELSLSSMVRLPNKINIIKSTMKHEGGARGYTFLNNTVLKELTFTLFAHEMFHIFTRYNPIIAKEIYKTMDFEVADQLILPHNNKLQSLFISNPDTPQIVFTKIKFNNKDMFVTPLLHSTKKYSNRILSFFDEMQVSLLFVEKRNYKNETVLVYEKINPNYINIDQSDEYKQKLGENTLYNIHPEEVSAKHFEFLMNGTWKSKKNTNIIQKLIKLLQTK